MIERTVIAILAVVAVVAAVAVMTVVAVVAVVTVIAVVPIVAVREQKSIVRMLHCYVCEHFFPVNNKGPLMIWRKME